MQVRPEPVVTASVNGGLAVTRRRGPREQAGAVDGVEPVGAAAELAAHLDLAELLDDRVHLAATRANAACSRRARASSGSGRTPAPTRTCARRPPRTAGAAACGRRVAPVPRRSRCRPPAARAATHPRPRPRARRRRPTRCTLAGFDVTGRRCSSRPLTFEPSACSQRRVGSCSELSKYSRRQSLIELARERHDALVAARRALVLDRDRQRAVAGEHAQVARVRRVAKARHRAQCEAVAAFDEHQVHRALAAQLQRQQALVLERRRQQRGGRDRFAERCRAPAAGSRGAPSWPATRARGARAGRGTDSARRRNAAACRPRPCSVRPRAPGCPACGSSRTTARARCCARTCPAASTATVTGMSLTSNS